MKSIFAAHPHHFNPWHAFADSRSCWTCQHSIGIDGVHLWCERARVVPNGPCGNWQRGAGCDEREYLR